MYNHTAIHPKDIAPNCQHCGKPVKIIRQKGEKKATYTAEIGAVYFTPVTETSEYTIEVICNGKCRTGIPARDGLVGFRLHNCHQRRETTTGNSRGR